MVAGLRHLQGFRGSAVNGLAPQPTVACDPWESCGLWGCCGQWDTVPSSHTPGVSSMSRTRKIAIGVLIVLLAAAPFVPRGSDEDGSVTPIGKAEKGALATSATAGLGRVSPAMQAEIDRVVGAGRSVGRVSTKVDPSTLADRLVRCADFEGQRYCLGTGWTTRPRPRKRPDRHRGPHRHRPLGRTAETTGDLAPWPGCSAWPPSTRERRGRAARAHPGGPLGREGLAPAPRDRGRGAARRLPGRAPRGRGGGHRRTAAGRR